MASRWWFLHIHHDGMAQPSRTSEKKERKTKPFLFLFSIYRVCSLLFTFPYLYLLFYFLSSSFSFFFFYSRLLSLGLHHHFNSQRNTTTDGTNSLLEQYLFRSALFLSFCPPFLSFVAHPNGVHPPFLPYDCDFFSVSPPPLSVLFIFVLFCRPSTVTTGRTTDDEKKERNGWEMNGWHCWMTCHVRGSVVINSIKAPDFSIGQLDTTLFPTCPSARSKNPIQRFLKKIILFSFVLHIQLIGAVTAGCSLVHI